MVARCVFYNKSITQALSNEVCSGSPLAIAPY